MHYVLLPGLHGSARLFEPFVAAAPEKASFTAVAYPANGPQDYDTLTAVARGALPQNRPYVIIAESFSGPIGVRLAGEQPPGLQRLILVATFVTPPVPLARVLAKAPNWLYHLLPMRTRLPRVALAGLRRGDFDEVLKGELEQVSLDTFRRRVRALLCVDVREVLQVVSVPVTYLQATRDRTVLGWAARAVKAVRKDAAIIHVSGPHLLLQCAPEAAWAAICAV